jgi:hypothetical protein
MVMTTNNSVSHYLLVNYGLPLWTFGMGGCVQIHHMTPQLRHFLIGHNYGWSFTLVAHMDLIIQTSSFCTPQVNRWLLYDDIQIN